MERKRKNKDDVPKKEIEPGVIYLSRIPTRMSVKKIREIFSMYGEVGHVFLQPDSEGKLKRNLTFTEGWVEFMNKKIAKNIAQALNNTQVPGKRKHAWFQELWNIKYLPKFKWAHLNERQAYEREVHKQKLMTEIAHAKRSTNFFIENVQREESKQLRLSRKRRKLKGKQIDKQNNTFTQSQPKLDSPPRKFSKTETEQKTEGHSTKTFKSINDKNRNNKTSKNEEQNTFKLAENKSLMKRLFSGGV